MPIIYPLAACYLLGLTAAAYLHWHPLIWLGGAAAGLCAALAGMSRRERVFATGLCVAAFFTAAFMFQLDEHLYRNNPMRQYIAARDRDAGACAMRGVVRSAPVTRQGRARFDMQVEQVRTGPGAWTRLRGRVRVILPEGARAPRMGSRVQFEGMPAGLDRLDPDLTTSLRRRDVAGFVFAHPAAPVRTLGRARVFPLFRWGEALRARLGAVYTRHLREPYAAVMGRMVFGSVWDMPRGVYDAFRAAGVVHVLVVSGLHVSVLLGAFLWLAFLWKNNPWVSVAVLCPALALFIAMTGGGPSITRAALMGLVFLTALAAGREYHALPALCWAALLMMWMDPHAPFHAGAQLSFLACLGIIVLYPLAAPLIPDRWPRAARWPLHTLLVSLCAQAPLYPVIASQFHNVSLVSPISNIAAVPLAIAALALGLICGVLGAVWDGFAVALAPALQGILWLLVHAVRWFASLPFSNVPAARPSAVDLALYGAALAGAAMTLRAWRRGRGQAVTWWLLGGGAAAALLAWGFVFQRPPQHARITFLDVGQGDSALVEAPCGPGRAPVRVLVDGGGGADRAGQGFDQGERVVGGALLARGITRLDLVVATHPEEDHLNGLLWSLENLHVARVVDLGFAPGTPGYARFRAAVRARHIPYTRGREGLALRAGSCLDLAFLHPPPDFTPLAARNPNDVSLVMLLRFGEHRVLFAGDVEGWAEDLLVRNHAADLRCDVLKVPHHGSATSSSPAFLDAAAPRWAVISAGRANMYGHPHARVLHRLRGRGIRVLRTDRHGDIDVFLPPRGPLRVRTQLTGAP